MKITVRIDKVYGNTLIYPVCDKAKLFAAISGTKTLSNKQILMIEELGFDITVEIQKLK